VVAVRIYVEGGAKGEAATRCRIGFAGLFANVVVAGRKPKVVSCGGRDDALRDFRTGLKEHPDEVVLLLVDSEDRVDANHTPWDHLESQTKPRPAEAGADSAHLMVQCMESWLLADPDTLQAYYGQGFRKAALPQGPLEQIDKKKVYEGLTKATAQTKKGTYHKVRHGFDLLARLDTSRLQEGSAHAQQLFTLLRSLCS
jgi:Domain of unknown function (DUF4276)